MEGGPGWHRVSPHQAALHVALSRLEVGRSRLAVQGEGDGGWAPSKVSLTAHLSRKLWQKSPKAFLASLGPSEPSMSACRQQSWGRQSVTHPPPTPPKPHCPLERLRAQTLCEVLPDVPHPRTRPPPASPGHHGFR